MYNILPYSYNKAKNLGVTIIPSTKQYKKIDVIKNDKIIASIGDIRYDDYPTYLRKEGVTKANERRRLYHIRHKDNKGLAGYYAKNILW